MKFVHNGEQITAFLTTIPIRSKEVNADPGQWIVSGDRTIVMSGAQFEAEFGETLKGFRHLYDCENKESQSN